MQRYSIELGAVDDQHSCGQFIPEDVVAAHRADCVCHSARHFTEWFPHPRHRPPLRECRPADDSQRNSPPRRLAGFCGFTSSLTAAVSVAAQGGDSKAASPIELNLPLAGGFSSFPRLWSRLALVFFHFTHFFGELSHPISGEMHERTGSRLFDAQALIHFRLWVFVRDGGLPIK